MQITADIFDIQRFSIHDGPGIRTTVFFKGCSLRCLWCHNPESLKQKPQYSYDKTKCISCGNCLNIDTNLLQHPSDLLSNEDINIEIPKACPTKAIKVLGETKSIEEIMSIILRDKPYYDNSGGGVTLSGGEAALQPQAASELLKQCKLKSIHTAIETAGNIPWKNYEQLLPYLDLVLFDIKHLDPDIHQQLTGANNKLILENLYRIINNSSVAMTVRIPIIPGYNDQAHNFKALEQLLQTLSRAVKLEFLPYHKLGINKYEQVGLEYKLQDVTSPQEELINKLNEQFGGVTSEV